jgi:hypothetical protein
MADRREPSHPPSDPHPALTRAGAASSVAPDRPARFQLAAALLLGLVLVGSGLCLWRRPHTSSDAAAAPAPPPSALASVAVVAAPPAVDAGAPAAVVLSDARVLSCHDRGPRRTAPDQCDHPAAVEQALSSAIERSASCVPPGAGGGTIEYVADVSFLRHRLRVTLPRAGRSIRDRKVLRACSAAVRGAIEGLKLDGMAHQHARYEIAVTATYRGAGSSAE